MSEQARDAPEASPSHRATGETTGPRTIGIWLFEDVEELDAVGPWEVLPTWTALAPAGGWRGLPFAEDGASVRCVLGLEIGVHCCRDALPPLDVLVLPGGNGTRELADRPEIRRWVRELAERGTLLASVCTGARILASAGLLARRPGTTHWQALDEIAATDPTIDLRPTARFVDDGNIITAAGISAGIDMSLHLVAKLAGPARASQVRRELQYDPAPPVPKPHELPLDPSPHDPGPAAGRPR